MKVCTKCEITKELKEFSKNKYNKMKTHYWCKSCMNKHSIDWYFKNKDRIKENRKQYRHTNSKKAKNNHLKRNFNLSLDEYNRLIIQQNNCCSICKKNEDVIDKRLNKPRNLCVDHCHKTGKFRALLCSRCNKGIGLLKEDIQILENAIQYLKEHK